MTQPTEISPARPPGPRQRFVDLIALAAREYLDACPVSVPLEEQARVIDRVKAAFRAAAARDPKLYECTPASVGRAFAFCALSGLTPGGTEKHVDLIPRKGKGRKVAGRWVDGEMQLEVQVGFRGFVALAERAGVELAAVNVFRADKFTYEEGLKPKLRHVPKLDGERTWETLVASYVRATLPSGQTRVVVMPRSEIEERRAASDSWEAWCEWKIAQDAGKPLRYRNDDGSEGKERPAPSCPWVEWPKEMAQKTVIRYGAARGRFPMDAIFQLAMRDDGRRDVIEGEVLEATPATAPEARQLADQSGLDGLAELLEETGEAELVEVERAAPATEAPAQGPAGRRRRAS